jgi:hypothetical protein
LEQNEVLDKVAKKDFISMNYQCNFNPLEKFMGQVEKNEKLYEALLQSEREKVQLLEKILNKS